MHPAPPNLSLHKNTARIYSGSRSLVFSIFYFLFSIFYFVFLVYSKLTRVDYLEGVAHSIYIYVYMYGGGHQNVYIYIFDAHCVYSGSEATRRALRPEASFFLYRLAFFFSHKTKNLKYNYNLTSDAV